MVAAFNEDGRSDGVEGLGNEFEGVVGGGSACEQAHHKLVGGRAMEPPLEVRGKELVDGVNVLGAQRVI